MLWSFVSMAATGETINHLSTSAIPRPVTVVVQNNAAPLPVSYTIAESKIEPSSGAPWNQNLAPIYAPAPSGHYADSAALYFV